nr:hypothetical protein [uncultured Desulfobacter sp.]
MNFVKTKIALLFNDWKNSEDKLLEVMEDSRLAPNFPGETQRIVGLEKTAIEKKLKDMDRYYEIFKKIEQSPETYFDMNAVLELGKALGFPSLFAILSALFTMFSGM